MVQCVYDGLNVRVQILLRWYEPAVFVIRRVPLSAGENVRRCLDERLGVSFTFWSRVNPNPPKEGVRLAP